MKNKAQLILLVSGIILFTPFFSFAQKRPFSTEEKMKMHNERPGDPYLPNPYNGTKTSPAGNYYGSGIITRQVNVNSSGQNILGDAANEPSIAVDPADPNHITIGWRQFDNVGSNFRQAGWSYSSDAGMNWTFPGVIDPGVFRSDPVLGFDTTGNFYYNSLTYDGTNYMCKVFKSTNGGAAWNAGVDARGGDKQWMTLDRTSGTGSGNIYSFWTSYYSVCLPGFFTRSSNGGSSFEDCVQVGGNPYWGNMAVGPDGELYCAGGGAVDGLMVSKSINAQVPGSSIIWNFSTQIYMDGYVTGSAPINPVGILGQANVAVDCSSGPGRGNVYVLAALQRISNGDPGDVMFARSTDGGHTFSTPLQINDDGSFINTQWLAVMSVAPNGRIDVAWLDTRDDLTYTDQSALYYSYSNDQGATWSVNEKLSESFDPHVGYPQQDKMGDYFDMVSDNTGAHLAWTNTLNGEEDVYYSHITPGTTGINDGKGKDNYVSLSCFPNPVKTEAQFRYQIKDECAVNMVICDVSGKEISTLVNKMQTAGIYTVDFSAGRLAPGYYLCRLTAGTAMIYTRLVVVK
ncbi:MAG: T9SS type A sorting domain-containing protein [Bacteroidetes bacterium]|nr:T9SS type A sorting domain-containing protein [Bacteroidota bacterium]